MRNTQTKFTGTSAGTQLEINFDKFMDDELVKQRRKVVNIDTSDNPYRALERKTRRSPSEVTVIK